MRTCERIDGRTTEFALNCRYRGQDVRVAVKFRRASDDLVVLLHGIGCSKETFDAAFATPELDIYSICAIDLPGHGKSSKGLSYELYTLSSYAAVTKRAISQLQKRNGEPFRVYIAGHSMGGAVGVLVAGMRQIRGEDHSLGQRGWQLGRRGLRAGEQVDRGPEPGAVRRGRIRSASDRATHIRAR